MQEYGWHHRNDFRDMIGAVRGDWSVRRLRLVACACARRLGESLDTPRIWQAIEISEDLAGGAGGQLPPVRQLTQAIIEEVRVSLLHDRNIVPEWVIGAPGMSSHAAWLLGRSLDAHPVVWAARVLEVVMHDSVHPEPFCRAIDDLRGSVDSGDRELLIRERTAQCDILRDIFGNPFRPVAFSLEWRTDTAVALAQTMYDSRDFSAMPILADALQDVGCNDEQILAHCRDAKQPHVRGCWVVDLVLGKE